MMGKWIADPGHEEGSIDGVPGLGILPVETTITSKKITEQCTFTFRDSGLRGRGYEIHMGETSAENESPLCRIEEKKTDGYFLDGKTWGTYIHGIFDNTEIVKTVLAQTWLFCTQKFGTLTIRKKWKSVRKTLSSLRSMG